MTKRQKTTFTPQVDGLERREVLSTFINTSFPYVVAPANVPQFAVNFTSNTFHQVWNSLNAGARNLARTGNLTLAETQLTALSREIPYGQQVLLPTWLADVNNAIGSTTPTPATVKAALNAVENDLRTYLVDNEGTAFNVQKSGVNWSTDGLLTYNSRVGHGVARGQEPVIGVTPTGL